MREEPLARIVGHGIERELVHRGDADHVLEQTVARPRVNLEAVAMRTHRAPHHAVVKHLKAHMFTPAHSQ